MYDELVKKLRRCGKGICTEDCPDWTKENLYHTCQDEVTLEAADAIDELDKLLDGVSADNDSLCEKIERMQKPRWIPATEQKPPLPEDEDVCYVQVIGAVKGKKEAEPVLYSRAYRLRDGKRVRIERFVGDGEVLEVTHWMLMPEPPKEET